MKNIPNFITLLNLFFGCCSIVTTLTAYPYYKTFDQDNQYVQLMGLEDLYWGAIFIFLAAVMDMLDGLAARVLKAESPMGEILDSLADVVSFGVAPAVIMYQLLWYAYVSEPEVFDRPWLALLPAFIIPCMGAWRLARFNTYKSTTPQNYFTGMPIPAAGLIIAAIPLCTLFEYNFIGQYFANKWVLYGITILVSYLMVSNIKFRKWNSGIGTLSTGWPIYLLALVFVSMLFIQPYSALFITMVAYLLVSILVPYNSLNAPKTAE